MIHDDVLPTVYPESFTTLPEDRFTVVNYPHSGEMMVLCGRCQHRVTDVDDGNDLNTLVRLSHAHLAVCGGANQ